MQTGELTLQMALIVAVGVFLASFTDAIAGGGGIISVPTYLIAGLPAHYALGTNKLSAGLGTIASTGRFIKNGYVDWKLGVPSIVLALIGYMFLSPAAREVDATAELNARDEARAKRKAKQRGDRARKIRERNER